MGVEFVPSHQTLLFEIALDYLKMSGISEAGGRLVAETGGEARERKGSCVVRASSIKYMPAGRLEAPHRSRTKLLRFWAIQTQVA